MECTIQLNTKKALIVQYISKWYLSYMLSQYANIHVQLSMEPRFLGLGFIVCIYVLCPHQHFFSVMLGHFPVLVDWTITKQRIKVSCPRTQHSTSVESRICDIQSQK